MRNFGGQFLSLKVLMNIRDAERRIVEIFEENLSPESQVEFEGEIHRFARRIIKEVVEKAVEAEKNSWATLAYSDMSIRH